MREKGLVDFFEKYLEQKPIFRNKHALQTNYTPEQILHRDEQIKTIAQILAPSLKQEKPSNLFIYGKSGTGKTLTTLTVTKQLEQIAHERQLPLRIIYLNCKLKKVADTEYRLIAHIAREFGKAIPPTGLPTEEVYESFFKAVEEKPQIIILVLDEIDQLVGRTGDGILYNLTRINAELKNSQVGIIGISNDLAFTNFLDSRIKSSLNEEELVFPPYNAIQLQHILKQRAKHAFAPETLEEGLIEKCAAYAAREHGDARRAIDLLRVAGELAERAGATKVTIKHLDQAESKIECDTIFNLVANQPKQYQATLYSIFLICSKKKSLVFTGEVYDLYNNICSKTGLKPLTQRRVSDIIAELDMLGIINAKVISKGRYGRTREISLATQDDITPNVLKLLAEDLGL